MAEFKFLRDLYSKGLRNANQEELIAYKIQRNRAQQLDTLTTDINTMREELRVVQNKLSQFFLGEPR